MNYHLENMPSKVEDICDLCGGELFQRPDDNPETIKNRWKVFIEENQKILDFYEKQGKLVKIDARGNKDDVFQRIKKKFG